MMLENLFKKFLDKKVNLITVYDFVCTGVFKINNSLVYDEYKYIVEDGNSKYYFNPEDIVELTIVTEEN